MSIAENYRTISDQIQFACGRVGRDPREITLIAVSKTFSAENIREAHAAGIRNFGENKVQEAGEKFSQVADLDITRHFIGHLQSNKMKDMLRFTDLLHSVDSLALAKKLSDKLALSGGKFKILVQVNTSREATKSGIDPEQAAELIQAIRDLPNLQLCGLMTIGAHTENETDVRKSFQCLREIMRQNPANGFNVLSMGMSSDYQWAIEEGATHLRIGGALFGTRVY